MKKLYYNKEWLYTVRKELYIFKYFISRFCIFGFEESGL